MCLFKYPSVTDQGETTTCYVNVAVYTFLKMLAGGKKESWCLIPGQTKQRFSYYFIITRMILFDLG